MKTYVYSIRLEFQMEIEQRYVVSFLRGKGMKLPAIVAELVEVYHEDAFDENKAKYWIRKIKLHRFDLSDLSDQASSGQPPLEDVDA
jgi:hypothetical protein